MALARGYFTIGAGRSWQVTSIDEERKKIYVKQTKSSRIPSWTGNGGGIHTKVVRRMKQVLQEDAVYAYLRPNAVSLLERARAYAAESGLLSSEVLPCGDGSFFIAPWVGTKEIRTISKLLSCGLKQKLDVRSVEGAGFYLRVTSGLGIADFLDQFRRMQIDMENPDLILPKNQAPKIDKYDAMVPEHLRRSAYLYNQMCIPEAIEIINGLV